MRFNLANLTVIDEVSKAHANVTTVETIGISYLMLVDREVTFTISLKVNESFDELTAFLHSS